MNCNAHLALNRSSLCHHACITAASGLGYLAIFPLDVLEIILLKAGARKIRAINSTLKRVFDEVNASLSISPRRFRSSSDNDDIGLLIGNVIRSSRALVSLMIHGSVFQSAYAWSSCASERLIDAIITSWGTLKGLQTLRLPETNIGPEGAASLAPALMALTGLRTLDLNGNALGPAGASSLALSLMMLTDLDLGGNALGSEGAAFLAPFLMALTGLSKVKLGYNDLGPAGAASLATSLISLAALKMLDLSHNNIGPAGAASLAPAFMALTALKKLDLCDNNLGPAGAASLAPALIALTGLKKLNLSFNGIGSVVAASLESSLMQTLDCYIE